MEKVIKIVSMQILMRKRVLFEEIFKILSEVLHTYFKSQVGNEGI